MKKVRWLSATVATACLVIGTTATAADANGIPEVCPNSSVIGSSTVFETIISNFDGTYNAYQMMGNLYDTPNSWLFAVQGIPASSQDEAAMLAKNDITAMQFSRGPYRGGDAVSWRCSYQASSGHEIFAATYPVPNMS